MTAGARSLNEGGGAGGVKLLPVWAEGAVAALRGGSGGGAAVATDVVSGGDGAAGGGRNSTGVSSAGAACVTLRGTGFARRGGLRVADRAGAAAAR